MNKVKKFANRSDLIQNVQSLSPWARGDASTIIGGRIAALKQLSKLDPVHYGRTRNYGNGSVSRLSPFIRHGVLSINEVRNAALERTANHQQTYKFIQELAWREFWQTVYRAHPEWLWQDVEPYKTGFTAADYADELPDDICSGKTETTCINAFIQELISTGYLHNHTRMYVASYIVHFRRIKWQAGARWFLHHLLDGDLASNNFSWQWIASTFSEKPYIFNLENVNNYFGGIVNTSQDENQMLAASYAELSQRLFPQLGKKDA